MAKKIPIVTGALAKVILPTFQQLRAKIDAEGEKQQDLPDGPHARKMK